MHRHERTRILIEWESIPAESPGYSYVIETVGQYQVENRFGPVRDSMVLDVIKGRQRSHHQSIKETFSEIAAKNQNTRIRILTELKDHNGNYIT